MRLLASSSNPVVEGSRGVLPCMSSNLIDVPTMNLSRRSWRAFWHSFPLPHFGAWRRVKLDDTANFIGSRAGSRVGKTWRYGLVLDPVSIMDSGSALKWCISSLLLSNAAKRANTTSSQRDCVILPVQLCTWSVKATRYCATCSRELEKQGTRRSCHSPHP